MTINEFHIKFEVFQECVQEWLEELNNDLHTIEEFVDLKPKSEQEYFAERQKIIQFPNNGKRKSKPVCNAQPVEPV